MKKLRQLLIPGRDKQHLSPHLTDNRLVSPLSKEMTFDERQHLAGCPQCRARRERLEDWRAESMVHLYRDALERDEGLPPLPDAEFQQRLRLRIKQASSPGRSGLHLPKIAFPEFPRMNPILATGMILAMASVICVFVWMQQSRPAITSNALLVRAEAWDPAPLHHGAPGVIRQTVEITTPKRTLKCTIYRDAQGKREARKVDLAPQEELLKNRLAEADVLWDAPLSAASYQDWHDAQRVREDRIRRAAGDLLVLTTTTPEGTVAAESLTVRDTDFHPVRRTVSFRDSETVEIAEIDYSVLPWSPATSSLFQPEEEMRVSTPSSSLQPVAIPLPPRPLTDSELDDAELSTRLTLDRLHADTGEQIEVVRGPHGIEVRGITDTEQRKEELEAQLDMLSHVTASISSIEELKAKPPQQDDLSSVKVLETQSQATPLEIYYLAHNRNIAPLSDLAQRLFNSAFAINIESKAIDDLQSRFSQDGGMSPIGAAALSDLLFTHKHRLLSALETEKQLLTGAQIGAPHSTPESGEANTNRPLTSLAERNLVLTRELALDKGGSSRPATIIASELDAVLDALDLRAHAVPVAPQDLTKLVKRK